MRTGELILYTTEDGGTRIRLRAEGGTVWLSQLEMAELFSSSKQNIGQHIKNVLADDELAEHSVVKQNFTTASDGKSYRTMLYNLDMILAVGYRVRSHRGTQFRQWATTHLREFLVKGFVMDDERLKDPGGWDYFDELIQRIRDIRASEKRFYQKIRDIYATAVDYDGTTEQAQRFFAKTQNKMLWAITGHTAAELIAARSDSSQPNMGLTSWKGGRVRRGDVGVAKNYLQQPEVDALNRIVVMYLDYAESMALRRKTMTMQEWADKLDAFLAFNEREVLTHAGKVSAEVAERLALERYTEFETKRRDAERLAADAEDVAALERIEQQLDGTVVKKP
ncbi:putative DNA-binding protein [Cupriavidus taiwanensis]|uniref:virulence RhuM family protein n=1 Tax=Cupriavidus taiwanensis TaxID=164546 RepID=UPI000E10D476|nr:virulence RhuM family protein [Cupriavidus taiwanensis]SPA28469.1 putative DNA-binding protein [Cupriavidus taiwanensis]SPA47784.1 putative DNA-binding protein [Cupriavidus taiwanensis]